MNDRELDRTIDDVLDGVATPAESAWLKQRLEEDPTVRARMKEQQALFRALEPGEMVSPPEDLLLDVLNAIRISPPPARASWRFGLSDALRRRPALGLGYTFATGVALGVIVVMAVVGRLVPAREPLPVTGTMAPTRGEPGWRLDDRARIVAGSALGLGRLESRGSVLMASVESRSAAPTHVTLAFDPARLTLTGFDRDLGALGGVRVAGGRIDFDTHGTSSIRIRLESSGPGEQTVRMSLQSAGTVGEAELHSLARSGASP